MSLSVPALLAAAVDADPTADVDVGDGSFLAVRELDRRSQHLAEIFLAAGMRPGGTVHVTTAIGADRAVQLLAAWRIGLLTNDHPATAGPARHAPCTPMNKQDREDRRQVAESRIWSETPAIANPDGTTVTHADLTGTPGPDPDPADMIATLIRRRPAVREPIPERRRAGVNHDSEVELVAD